MKQLNLFLFLLLCGLLSLGQLQRVPLGPFTAIYLHEIVLIIWSALLFFSNQSIHFSQLKRLFFAIKSSPVKIVLLVISIVGWILAAITNSLPLWTVLFTARLIFYLTWAWLVVSTKPISQNWWRTGYLAAGLSIMLLGFLQYIFIPDTRFLSILGWDDHYYRLLSTQLDPNFTGLLLTITLFWWWSTPFSWWQWLIHGLNKQQLGWVQQATTIAVSGLLLLAIGLTFSRASWLALLVGLGVVASAQKKYRTQLIAPSSLMVAGIGGLIIFATLFMQPTGEGKNLLRTASVTARLSATSIWLQSLTPYQLLLGRGLFVPPPTTLHVAEGISADHANLPDNVLILAISSFGIVGTILLLILCYQWLSSHQQPALTLAILAAVLTHSMFNNSLLQVFVLLFVLGNLIQQRLANN